MKAIIHVLLDVDKSNRLRSYERECHYFVKIFSLFLAGRLFLNDVCSRDDDGSLVAMLISEFDHIFSPGTLIASYLLTMADLIYRG